MREGTPAKFSLLLAASVLFAGVLTVVSHSREQDANSTEAINPAASAAAAELARYEQEYSSARIEPARMDSQYGIAVIFAGTDDLHYYAKSETAPAPGFELKVQAKSDVFDFGKPLFPTWSVITDPLGKKVEVYVGEFVVFIPIQQTEEPVETAAEADVTITGLACTSAICLQPFEQILQTKIDWSLRESWPQVSLESSAGEDEPRTGSTQPVWLALSLAFVAGLALNIMPCVWPVLPLIVMRIVGQAKKRRGVSVTMGLAFCLGILLFFALLAGTNIVLKVFYGTVLQWGDQFRNPTIVAVMSLLLVLLAMFMFGAFTITVPAAISGRQASGKGYVSSVGMGFLAAILSTPCSFGILAAAFAWAQSQPLAPATIAIMVIGIGMALPYAVLTSIPGLLNRLPKPGRWMELFKQGIGFVLLVIAVKLVTALPETRTSGVLYFAVVLAFCAWMWGSWVGFGTRPAKKWLVRAMAVLLAASAGWTFLPAPSAELIDWQSYDDGTIVQTAIEQGQPVLIKFTADWCLSCQAVEKTVYSRKDISDLIKQKNVLAIKADTTQKGFQATKDLQKTYHEPGVPVTMLFIPGSVRAKPDFADPVTGEIKPLKWRGILFASELKKNLEKLPDKPEPQSPQRSQ
ncbi:MAG: thioredoxin family protein [Sedimentisphaerales bacterium]|nr:thioredoxin family protein [Sedimentisphaerales bacterium]